MRRVYARGPIGQKNAPGLSRGHCSNDRFEAYRLTWMLLPPPAGVPMPIPRGPPGAAAAGPGETSLTQSESLSLKYEVVLALRSASRLLCCAPEAAVVNPGSWKITHEPLSSWLTLMGRFGLSVTTLISVPATTLVSPVAVNSLPLRLRTTGG